METVSKSTRVESHEKADARVEIDLSSLLSISYMRRGGGFEPPPLGSQSWSEAKTVSHRLSRNQRMGTYIPLQALELQGRFAYADDIVVSQVDARQRLGIIIHEGAVGGVKVGDDKPAVLIVDAGVFGGNGRVAQRDGGRGRTPHRVLAF